MKSKMPDTVEYREKIIDIPLSQIEINSFNPRKRFVESEEDELIDSILSKGLLNPIIVYKKERENKYVILDGERRYKAFLKLNYKDIPSHVLAQEPSVLENLSMMFHIHNVREEWTDFSIGQALMRVIVEMGKDVRNLERQDKLELSRLTSLSEYKINKYLVFYDYPTQVLEKFLDAELKEKSDRTKGLDPDILAEMHTPIQKIKKVLPNFLDEYSVKKIIDACIKKKANDVIKTNREFRLLAKALTATERGSIRKAVMFDKLEKFVSDINVTPQDIYDQTAATLYQVESILKKTGVVIQEIENLNLNQITDDERGKLEQIFRKLRTILRNKLP
jgi:ParB family transcriptional regulator, chromosome partitioning protein